MGNWSSSSPAAIAVGGRRDARRPCPRSSSPSSAFTRAAAALMRPSQCTTAAGIGSPETWKLATALSVSPPQSRSPVTRPSLAARGFEELVPASELDARPAQRLACRPLGRVDRLPPGLGDDADAALGRGARRSPRQVRRPRSRPARASSSNSSTVSVASFLLVPITPVGPRLIQPVQKTPGTGAPSVSTHAAAGVRDDAPLLVERNAREPDAVIPDAAQHDPARNRLLLVRRHGAQSAAAVLLEPVSHHPDGFHATVADDRDRRGEKAQPDCTRLAGRRRRRPSRAAPRGCAVPSRSPPARLRWPDRARGRPRRRRDPLRRARSARSSSGLVKAACTGPRRPSTRISRIPAAAIAAMAGSVVSVAASSSAVSASMRATSTATLPLPTTTARSHERSNERSWKSGWPLYQATNAVAGHEPGRSSPGMPMRRSVCAPKE